jgi:hypothetical protein
VCADKIPIEAEHCTPDGSIHPSIAARMPVKATGGRKVSVAKGNLGNAMTQAARDLPQGRVINVEDLPAGAGSVVGVAPPSKRRRGNGRG